MAIFIVGTDIGTGLFWLLKGARVQSLGLLVLGQVATHRYRAGGTAELWFTRRILHYRFRFSIGDHSFCRLDPERQPCFVGGSIAKMKKATFKEIQAVPTIGPLTAEKIFDFLHR